MVGEESNAPDDHSVPTQRALSKSLADQNTIRASESHQETPADSVAETKSPPDFIDHFEIRRRLGFGGFGSVYLAHDTKLDRMVALKLLDKLDKQAARRMLAEETRAASNLRHPHLVTVFQSGEHARGCYIVFEHIPGPDQQRARTLRELLRESPKKRLPPRKAVSIARHIALALAHAHQADVVHRDIKPENILLDDKGSAFLADFGCARRSRRHAAGVRSFVGTFPYMSLEQMEGRWNAQTDIWSLGVVLYEMLHGARPFAFAEKAKSRGAAEATFSFAAAIVAMEKLPPIPGVDVDLNAICRKCLQTDPDHRYRSAAELAEDLTRWQRNEPASCRRVGVIEQTRRWAQRNPLVATLWATLMLALAIGFVGSTYFAVGMRTAQKRYVDEQLMQLGQLEDAKFEAVLSSLQSEPLRPLAIRALSSQWYEATGTTSNGNLRNRMAAAIVTMQRAETISDAPLVAAADQRLLTALLTAKTPDEFRLIRKYAVASSDPNDKRIQSLWATARDDSNPAVQFRALSALADYDPSGEAWTGLATILAQRLLDQDAADVANWASNLSGLADRLVPILQAELNDDNETRRTRAAIAYATLASTPLELAKRIVNEQSPGVVRELLLQIKRLASTQQSLELLDELDAPPTGATARQLANLSVHKLWLGGSNMGDRLPMFEPTGDPLACCVFEMDAARYGLAPNLLFDWIDKLQSGNSGAAAVQTAVLAIGSTDLEQLPAITRPPIIEKLTAIYRGDDRAPVHAAAERVLRQWKRELPNIKQAEADRIRWRVRSRNQKRSRSSTAPSSAQQDIDNSWRINELGQLMVRFTLPEDKPSEITAYEITLGDYVAYVRSRAAHYGLVSRELSWIREPIKRHLNENTERDNQSASASGAKVEDQLTDPELQLPVRLISALQAVAYCVWVSEAEGLTDDQMAFRVRDDLKGEHESLLEAIERQLQERPLSPLLTVVAGVPGYRLPFSEEWETLFDDPDFLHRADDRVRDQLGWYRRNSQLELHAVGGKRPHRLGVFDAWGNVSEWCIASLEDSHVTFETLGSSYESPLGVMRPILPGVEVFGGHRAIGFRMIRTLE